MTLSMSLVMVLERLLRRLSTIFSIARAKNTTHSVPATMSVAAQTENRWTPLAHFPSKMKAKAGHMAPADSIAVYIASSDRKIT